MSQSISCNDRELRRLEETIAQFERGVRPARGQECLLAALKAEREELLRLSGRNRRFARQQPQRAA